MSGTESSYYLTLAVELNGVYCYYVFMLLAASCWLASRTNDRSYWHTYFRLGQPVCCLFAMPGDVFNAAAPCSLRIIIFI